MEFAEEEKEEYLVKMSFIWNWRDYWIILVLN